MSAADARARIRARINEGKPPHKYDLDIVRESAKIPGSSTSDPGKSRALLKELER